MSDLLAGPRCATTHQTTSDGIRRTLFATGSAVTGPICSCLIGRILKQGCLACCSPNDLITELVDRPAYRGEAKGHTVFVDDLDERVESIGARGI